MDTQTYPRNQLRVSDADRDRAIDELSGHFQAGRLTKEEFDERTGQALQARINKDLAALFTDLPRHRTPQAVKVPSSDKGGRRRPVTPYRAPMPRIGVVAFVVVAAAVLGGASGHPLLGLLPVLIVALVARCVFRGRRNHPQRFR